MMLRKLYYWLSPEWRFKVRKLWYLPGDIISNRSSLIPPKGLIYTGGGDFLDQGRLWKDFFINNGLKEKSTFLDVGSGIGRIAVGLTGFLKGNYEGFEAIEKGVQWCEVNITKKNPNFKFRYVPLYNDLYNSTGIDASQYGFEYEDETFDFGCAISVFTHMIDIEVENYLHEVARVLKPGGRFVATFFILDEESERLMSHKKSSFRFDFDKGNYRLMDDKVRSANVAFELQYLKSVLQQCGLSIVAKLDGSWSGRDQSHPLAFQDILVLEKK
ncbi:MAG: class I SAM-dependent methyltransferase [Saprospiraceae bacterium]